MIAARKKKRAFVIVYAIGVLALVAVLSNTMFDSTQSDNAILKRRVHLELARSAAASGIEYAMGVINHQLALTTTDDNVFKGLREGPYFDPFYNANLNPDTKWIFANDVTPKNPLTQEFPMRSSTVMSLNEGTSGAERYNVQFQITMWPALNYRNVNFPELIPPVGSNPNGIFRIRSRGEVTEDPDGAGPIPGIVQATAVVMQSFRVPGVGKQCGTPYAVRLLWEQRTKAPLGPVPWNVH
jgi:hypothetical protein